MRPPPPKQLTAPELRALLLHLLAGATGKPEHYWSKLVGEVAKRSMTIDPHCNWTVAAGGRQSDRTAIEKAAEIVREGHRWIA